MEPTMKNLANWFLRLAVLYFIAGVSLGLYMAASQDHTMHPVHAHLNLLGSRRRTSGSTCRRTS